MTDTEYLARRKELENLIALLDAEHLTDCDFKNGVHIHIDTGWKARQEWYAVITSRKPMGAYSITITR